MILESITTSVIANFIYDLSKKYLPKPVYALTPGLYASNSAIMEEAETAIRAVIDETYGQYYYLATVRKLFESKPAMRQYVLLPLLEYLFNDAEIPRQELISALISFREGPEQPININEKSIRRTDTGELVFAGEIADSLIDGMKATFRKSKNLQSVMARISIDQVSQKVRAIHNLSKRLNSQLEDIASITDKRFANFCTNLLETQKQRVSQLSISGAQRKGLKSSLKHVLESSFLDLRLIALTGDSGDAISNIPSSDSNSISAILAINTLQKIIIRGPAGCGKTTLLHWLINNYVITDENTRTNSSFFPIFIPLRRLEQGMVEDWNIRNVFRLTLASADLEAQMPPNFFGELLEKNIDFGLLLDGLDEVSEINRDNIWKMVESIEKEFPNTRIIITSRNLATVHLSDGRVRKSVFSSAAEYSNARAQWRPSPDFFEFVVAPLSNQRISIFVDRWFDGISTSYLLPGEKDTVRRYPSRLKLELFAEKHFDTLELARIPLLCALICLVFFLREGTLPRSRRDLYELATDILVEARDEQRNVRTPVEFDSFGRNARLSVLRSIALDMQEGTEQSIDQSIEASKNAVLLMVERWINKEGFQQKDAAQLLNFLIERCSIIREPALDRIDFIHRSFMEYLAAQEVVSSRTTYALRSKIELEQWGSTLQFCMNTPQGGYFYAGQLISELVAYVKESEEKKSAHKKPASWRKETYSRIASLISPSDEYPAQFAGAINELARHVLPPNSPDDINRCIGMPFQFIRDHLNYKEVVAKGVHAVNYSAILLARHEDDRCGTILNSGYQVVSDERVIEEINRSGRIDTLDHDALLARIRNKSFSNRKVFWSADDLRTKDIRDLVTKYVGLRFPLRKDKFVGWVVLSRCFDVTLQYACGTDWTTMLESVKKRRFDCCLSVELQGCTDFSFDMLARLFPRAKMILIDDCRHFSVAGLESFRKLEMLEFRRISQPLVFSTDTKPIRLESITFLSCGSTRTPNEWEGGRLSIEYGTIG